VKELQGNREIRRYEASLGGGEHETIHYENQTKHV